MSKKICFLILLQICLLQSLVLAEGITVTIAPQARVDGTTIILGQLATISGDDEEKKQYLRQLKMGNAPIPGSSFVLTREVIDMRLGSAGNDLAGVTWNIPSSVTVIGNSQVISAQTLVDKGISTIRDQVGPNVRSDDLTISLVGRVQDMIAPVGNVTLSASLPYGIRYNTPVTVMISANVNGQAVTKIGLKFNVQLFRQVAVAASKVNASEIFTEDSLRYERMDTGQIAAGYFTDTKKIVGLIARRPVTPGMVVTDSMVNKPVLIKRGSMVILIAFVGNMEVTASGQTMQDGYSGQLIRVRNVNSNKIVLGKIIDEEKVQVLTYKSASSSQ